MLSTIPLYVKAVGGTELEVGLVVAMFSAVSLCVRMPMGKACDVKGARPFMMAGAALLVLSGFVYSRCHSVSALFGARALHGVSWAFFGTSVYAQVAEIIPAARRGEAMGYYGISCNLAMALGPALGFALIDGSDFGAVFALSCGMAAMACLFAAPLRGRRPEASVRAENSSSGQEAAGGREEAGNAAAGSAEEKHSAGKAAGGRRRRSIGQGIGRKDRGQRNAV